MTIVFNSEDQKQKVISSFCVDELYIDRNTVCTQNCEECWDQYVTTDVQDEE